VATVIRAPKDFWTGVIYLAVGALGILVGREYSFGSAGRMGPGYFPFAISCLLLLFGVITVVRSFLTDGEPVGALAWKAIALVIGSVVAFGLLLPTAGLVIAMLVMVLMSAAASEKFRFDWAATAGLVGLVVFCSLVFVKGLGVPMPLVGTWLQPVMPAWLSG
jgi:uncharacterized membrane protein YhhN